MASLVLFVCTPPLAIQSPSIALDTRTQKLPTPAGSDAAKWEQYAALCEAKKNDHGDVISHIETPAARSFKEKYLVRK